jgi:hypothetical protein
MSQYAGRIHSMNAMPPIEYGRPFTGEYSSYRAFL